MSDSELQKRIADETARLIANGVPQFLAGIKAAANINGQVRQEQVARREALATSCNEA